MLLFHETNEPIQNRQTDKPTKEEKNTHTKWKEIKTFASVEKLVEVQSDARPVINCKPTANIAVQ